MHAVERDTVHVKPALDLNGEFTRRSEVFREISRTEPSRVDRLRCLLVRDRRRAHRLHVANQMLRMTSKASADSNPTVAPRHRASASMAS